MNWGNDDHFVYRAGGWVVFMVGVLCFWLLIFGELSVGHMLSCGARSLGWYVGVALLWWVILIVCFHIASRVIGRPLSTTMDGIYRFNHPFAFILFLWVLWKFWACLEITVNL